MVQKYIVRLQYRPIIEADSEAEAMELAAEELRLRLNEGRRKNEPLRIYFDTAWPDQIG